MEQTMKVLIATDSSCFAGQVLESVTKRAWSKDTEFRVITCIQPHADWNVEQELTRQCQLILDERVYELRRRAPGHKINGEVIEGNPSSSIAKAAKDWHADLIVIGSHGDTGIRQAHIGSVAAALANQAPCSIEIIKVQAHPNKKSLVAKESAAALCN
jgi:hypothetical protein